MTMYCTVKPKQILKLLNKKTQSGFRADKIKNKNIISEEKTHADTKYWWFC